MENKKEEAKRELLTSVKILTLYKEQDIIHDWGSMDKFFDMLENEVEILRGLYDYKLSSKENELLKKVTK